jgi:hypothetical protein
MRKEDRLFQLLDAVDTSESTVTSVRQPIALREAAKIAVELGMAANTNDVTVQALRDRLEAFAQHLALEEHFARYPKARPSLAELALVAAELDAHPLAGNEALLRTAASELQEFKPDAIGEDVLVYAMGMASKSRNTA